MTRRAKIVCTIGPASNSEEKLAALIEAGMDVARLNFSHGEHHEHALVIERVRRLAAEAGRPVVVLQDLQGPKIRVGALRDGEAKLVEGARFVLTTAAMEEGDAERAWVSYEALPQDARPGDEILLSDGLLRLRVDETSGEDVVCTVVDGGTLRQRAGVNLPGVQVSVPSLTDKDRRDLEFGIAQEVDFVALSFVRRASDVAELKRIIDAAGASIGAVAKLEKPQAIDDLDGILREADAVMVARGDLGVEMSPERVPFVQKQIIRRAFRFKVPVITATQMLESMIDHPRPTRAEASDVANAVLDGTDAVMLSGETAVGQYPVETVRMMGRIVEEAEKNIVEVPAYRRRADDEGAVSFPDATAEAACRIAEQVKAVAVVAFTQSSFTASLISKHRPPVPIVACTPHEGVFRRLGLYWGVLPRRSEAEDELDLEGLVAWAGDQLRREGLASEGDRLVILAGAPFGQRGTTNMIRLHRIGEG